MSETKPTIKRDPGATTGAGATMDQKPKPNIKMTARGRAHPNLKGLDAMTWSYSNWKADKEDAENSHFNAPSKFPRKLAAMKAKQKIHNGDRSHANLVALDSMTWTYHGWEGDKTIAEGYHCLGDEGLFTGRYDLMKRKQAVREGDRSDPILVTLDSQSWTYDGWQRDKKEVEGSYGGPYFYSCSNKLNRMKRAQALHDGDRSHAELRRLDAMKLNYVDWKIDKSTAEKRHIEGPSYTFSEKLAEMEDKQRSHEQKDIEEENTAKDWKFNHNLNTSSISHVGNSGLDDLDDDNFEADSSPLGDDTSEASGDDESKTSSVGSDDSKEKMGTEAEAQSKQQKLQKGPEVATPAALSAVLWTYPGWLDDESEVSKAHKNSSESFDALLKAMKKKQKEHDRSLDPDLVALDNLQLTYPGWENDKVRVESTVEKFPSLVDKKMDYLQKKEKLHLKDASDPRVQLLNSTWTYPDWESDKSTVEGFYTDSYCFYTDGHQNFGKFDDKLEGMKHKQQACEGDAACPISLLDVINESAPSVTFGDGSAANPVVLDDSTSLGARPRRVRHQPTKKRRNKGETTGTRNPTVNNSSKCVVCFAKDKSHILKPCGHRCVCNSCSGWALNENKCPVCNETVVSTEVSTVDETADNTLLDLTNKLD